MARDTLIGGALWEEYSTRGTTTNERSYQYG